MGGTKLRLARGLVFIAGCAAFPLVVTDPYVLHVVIVCIIGAVAALGIRLLMQVGQWNYGQASMLAIGAYSSVLLVTRLGWGFWPAFAVGGMASALFALVIGFPALRLKGAYFAILTLSLGVAIEEVIEIARHWTGGSNGLYALPAPSPLRLFGITVVFDSVTPNYYFALVLMLTTLGIMSRVDRSRLGLVMRGIEQNNLLAESVGISVLRFSLFAFVMGSLFAGFIGSFSATYYGLVAPVMFGTWPSIFFMIYVIVGGAKSIWGPVLGAALLIGGAEVLRATVLFQQIAFAVLLLVVIRLLPGGLVSLPDSLRRLAAASHRLLSSEKESA